MYAKVSKEIYGSVNIKDKFCKILLFFEIIDIISIEKWKNKRGECVWNKKRKKTK